MSDIDPLASPEMPGPRVSVFVARPGFGKTTRALETWWTWPRGVAIDTKHPDPSWPPDYPGLVAWTPAELAALLRKHGERERFRIVYRGRMSFPVDPLRPMGEQTVEPIFRAVAKVPHCLFVVDEADKFCTANYTPGKPDGGLYSIVHHGRTRGQGLVLCARRAAALPRDLTGSVEEFWTWPLDEPGDRKYVSDRGFDLDVLDRLTGYEALVKRSLPGEPATFEVIG